MSTKHATPRSQCLHPPEDPKRFKPLSDTSTGAERVRACMGACMLAWEPTPLHGSWRGSWRQQRCRHGILLASIHRGQTFSVLSCLGRSKNLLLLHAWEPNAEPAEVCHPVLARWCDGLLPERPLAAGHMDLCELRGTRRP